MKRLPALILILLFVSFTSFVSLDKRNSTHGTIEFGTLTLDDNMTDFERNLCEQLHFRLHPEADVIMHVDAYLPYGVMGVTYDLGDETYLIQISGRYLDDNDKWWTILHEWAHVNQFRTKKLEEVDRKTVHWMGAPADFSKGWSERPWEIEANERADKLWNEFFPYAIKPER